MTVIYGPLGTKAGNDRHKDHHVLRPVMTAIKAHQVLRLVMTVLYSPPGTKAGNDRHI